MIKYLVKLNLEFANFKHIISIKTFDILGIRAFLLRFIIIHNIGQPVQQLFPISIYQFIIHHLGSDWTA